MTVRPAVLGLWLLCLLWGGTAHAEIRLDMDELSVIGNRELPRIVYIMAWRKSPKGDILQQSLESMHSDEILPVDRDVFRRQIGYHDLLNALEPQPAETPR